MGETPDTTFDLIFGYGVFFALLVAYLVVLLVARNRTANDLRDFEKASV